MERCHLRDVPRLEGSLLGRDVRISRTERRPSAHRFLLGDHAEIEITEGRV
jgi:glucose-1-phosphate thymidylyltransferase